MESAAPPAFCYRCPVIERSQRMFRKSAKVPAPRIGAPKETTSLALCFAIALAWSILLALLSFTSRWQDHVEAKGFDELTIITAPKASKFPITIVGIDE